MILVGNNTHRNPVTSGYERDMPSHISCTRGYGAYRGRDAPGRGVQSSMPIRLSRGTSCTAFASWTDHSPLCNARTLPMAAHGGPASVAPRRSPGISYHALARLGAGAASLVRDIRCGHRATSRCSALLCRLTFVAITRGKPHRRNYATEPCLVACGSQRRTSHTQARQAAHAGRGFRLVGRAASAKLSRTPANRTNGRALVCSVVGLVLSRTSRMVEQRLSFGRRLGTPGNRTSGLGVALGARTERRNVGREPCLSLHTTYSRAGLVSNV